jgi:hypothetical protein
MERILQFDVGRQPLEWSIQNCGREEENDHTTNYIEKTRRLSNEGYKRNPTTHARVFRTWRQINSTTNNTQIRLQTQAPLDTTDDKEFTIEEIGNAIGSMGNKKAPGEDGITGEIHKSTFQIFPRYITALYNRCLTREVFPTRWKRTKVIPITKPGK